MPLYPLVGCRRRPREASARWPAGHANRSISASRWRPDARATRRGGAGDAVRADGAHRCSTVLDLTSGAGGRRAAAAAADAHRTRAQPDRPRQRGRPGSSPRPACGCPALLAPVELIGTWRCRRCCWRSGCRCGARRGRARATVRRPGRRDAAQEPRAARAGLALGLLLGLSGHALLAVDVCAALPTAQNVFGYAVRFGQGVTLGRDAGWRPRSPACRCSSPW